MLLVKRAHTATAYICISYIGLGIGEEAAHLEMAGTVLPLLPVLCIYMVILLTTLLLRLILYLYEYGGVPT